MDTTIVYIIYSVIGIFMLWAAWEVCRPYKKVKEFPYKEAKSSPLKKNDRRFVPNEEFCAFCFTHEYFWLGGGATAPERCPWHKEDDDGVLLWKNMSLRQRNKGAKRFQKMWREQHNTNYKFTVYED